MKMQNIMKKPKKKIEPKSKNKTILLTGGAGFFGSLLKERLLERGFKCVSIDLYEENSQKENLITIKGDIRNLGLLDKIFEKYNFEAIFHCAAILAHDMKDKNFLWTSNVNGTKNIAEMAKKYRVKKIIFTSSNCLWGNSFGRLVTEEDIPKPIEIYGLSKAEGEKILNSYKEFFKSIIIRCPTIIDAGRLGLLAILFEFADEGRKLWVVGNGKNRYQFIYAQDLIDACLKCLNYEKSAIFNIGSENVKTFREVYQFVIDKANTGSKVAFLPKTPAIFAMKLSHFLKISPLGPYQYKMIAEDFIFDISKIKKELKWKPTLMNEEMLYKSYVYYKEKKEEISKRKNVSAHKRGAKMGVIKLLKWFS
jgi:UDP-glucose 4-epimerase